MDWKSSGNAYGITETTSFGTGIESVDSAVDSNRLQYMEDRIFTLSQMLTEMTSEVNRLNRCLETDRLAYVEILQDIKDAEKALRQSEDRFHKIFSSIPAAIAIIQGTDGCFVEVNQKFLALTGYSLEELYGHSPQELKMWMGEKSPVAFWQEMIQHGRIPTTEVSIRTKSGERVVTMTSVDRIELNGRECWMAVINDITKEKQYEKEMARLARLNMVGEMAASLGHEIRNPMTSVSGFLQLLKGEIPDKQEYFDLMLEELDRANDIISEFLSMARDKPVELQPHYLDAIVKTVYPILHAKALFAENQLICISGRPPRLMLDEKELRQLILNLAQNGIESMVPGGTLTIGTGADPDEIFLYVKDEGKGIPAEVLEQLGTPFVTTKTDGTGLGLAVCYSIAHRHGARIDVETGKSGTTFLVKFPRSLEVNTLF